MTKKLVWRLGKLPTVDELQKLVTDKIITKEEAREVLFNETEYSERSIESYKEEIKFLREVIDKLGEPKVIREYITQYIPQYIKQPFYQPYWLYAGNGTLVGNNGTAGLNCRLTDCTSNTTGLLCSSSSSITDIQTF